MDEVLRLEEWGARDNSDCNIMVTSFFVKISSACREAIVALTFFNSSAC